MPLEIYFEDTEFKTCLDASRTGLKWQQGDSVVVSNDFDASTALCVYSGGGKMMIDVPAGATSITAKYPAAAVSATTQHQAVAGTLNGRNYPLSATAQIQSGSATLKFSPVGSAFAMNVFNPNTDGEKLLSIRVNAPQMKEARTVTMDTPFELDKTAPQEKKTYDKQVYLCLDRAQYNKVNFHVVTDSFEYDITSNEVYMDCSSHDFLVLNLDLGHCKVSLTGYADCEDFTSGGTITIGYIEPENKEPEGPEDLDFSRVGYHYSDTPLPTYPVGKTVTLAQAEAAVSGGTASSITDFLQKALDSTPDGTALLVKEGTYVTTAPLNIQRSIVLRGEGADKTIIKSDTGPDKSTVVIGKGYSATTSSQTTVTDSHVPVGAFYVNVADVSLFNVGDEVIVRRPGTAEWIHAIRMDQIDDPVHPAWDPKDFDMELHRIITRIIGTRLYFDLPLPMDIDSIYGGATVVKATVKRLTEAGVEDLTVMSDYDPSITTTATLTRGSKSVTITYESDENHSKSGVTFRAVAHCWAKGVTARNYISWSFGFQQGSRLNTITDCHSLHPVSLITGSRRYAFNMARCEGCLVENCTADEDRHMFVTPNRADGPNVFYNCTGTNCFSNAGPHCYWATMTLYDNVSVDGTFSVEDVGGEADLTSHGWQGANHVLWNCTAAYLICHNPWATAKNYAYGCIGTKQWGTYFWESPVGKDPAQWISTDKWRLDGQWYPSLAGGQSGTAKVTPNSLYESQLQARHAAGGYIWK